jgi:hypothetical protein
MSSIEALSRALIAVAFSLLLCAPLQSRAGALTIDDDDIGGVVTSANGPEAGVWVIAETTDLPTKLAKIVVTDDQGRYVLPDLPKANYQVWVRGYGLIDSPKVAATPGKLLDLTAIVAPSRAAAAQYYPAIYWYAMLKIPDKSEFPGKGPENGGLAPHLKSQAQWLDVVKTDGCFTCHQLGNAATRTIPSEFLVSGSSVAAWARRIQSGQAMTQMANAIARIDAPRALELFADWTDRIAAGALPASQPSRPQGIERNVVITLWDWAGPKTYLHDEIATDRRNPTVNANGPLYGSPEESTDLVPILDPIRHTKSEVKMPVRDPNTPSSKNNPMQPSAYWHDEPIWDSQASMHNPMLDEKGRVWFTSRIRPAANPLFCRKGSEHPSAKLFPLDQSNRQLAMYDPASGKFTLIDTCFPTHHLQFAEDANHTLWTSAGGPGAGVVGWLNRKLYEETGDEQKAQGWTALVLDTNGDGKRDEYVEPDQQLDPSKDKRIAAAFYGVAPNPADGSIWGSVLGFPGAIVRLDPGNDPPATALAEIYEPPLPGYSPRGMDIDRNGVVWAPLASGHFASFDRRKCKGPLNGPKATGDQCPEGFAMHKYPGPGFDEVPNSSAEASYYTWVDVHNAVGFGDNVPISTANLQDGFVAFKDGQMILMRVPYPMGYYAKGLDGRIDDPNAGWKGRGLWSASGDRTPWLNERGKGAYPMAVHMQVRPDPLAH